MTLRSVKLYGNPLSSYRRFRRDPLAFLQSTDEIGDLVQIPSVTGQPTFVVNHPHLVRAILVTDETKVRKGQSSEVLGYTLGTGLLTSEGQQHEEQKTTLMPAFHATAMKRASDRMVQLTDERRQTWPLGQPFNVSDEMLDLTLHIVYEALFGQPLKGAGPDIHRVVSESVRFSSRRLLSALSLPYRWPVPSHQRHKQAVTQLDDIIRALIDDARQGLRLRTRDHPTNLLDLLLTSRHPSGEPWSHQELRDQIATLIIAGHETTSNLMSWIIYLLAKHPDVQSLVRQEVIEAIGDGNPAYDDIHRLPLVQMVIREAMRLYPPAWSMLRETTEPISVEDARIPAGAAIIISPYVIQRSPRWFDRPNEFDPSRFRPEALRSRMPFSYFPFGAGNRVCIGNQFAQMEASLILALMVQRGSWQINPDYFAVPEPSVSLRVRGGLTIYVNSNY